MYFWEHPLQGITCDDIEAVFPGTLLTSIRRSLTNLSQAGNLVKTGQRTGQHGRPVNIYSFIKL
jgi:predicted transcriptional regulator